MNKKGLIQSAVITTVSALLLLAGFLSTSNAQKLVSIEEVSINKTAKDVYQVYLDGEKIGLIEDELYLYDLINKEQVEIKEE